ncbi:MAG: HD domain-containing protein [Alphaproteobacteria bacterium]|nr:HD domain-containing protein [Alphaproteobacteria bacterium]MBU1514340.1 HD domain-containing protein [Alphaproteobacteria bacterium]MBU2095984.1 HD domain-containing protein [Alphaproteobacteria bacterium]MBU2153082.1 HD domain-containing protein [Alphaproteobacteria bacterium]MBU2308539.1 HD domain-containing protein [Alphaproteobacteria bacterium]
MADGEIHDRAQFTSMTEGTLEDWQAIGRASLAHRGQHVDRILSHFMLLHNDYGGFNVDRLEHSLQTATRAHRAGHDEEYVVCALLHDIGDILLPASHAELGAAILKPYISEQNHWMLEKHGIFQGYYFFHHLGLDRDMREEWRGHEWFEYTAQFCHLYDQNSFEPGYDTMPLEAFVPMMRRVMDVPKHSIYRKPQAA